MDRENGVALSRRAFVACGLAACLPLASGCDGAASGDDMREVTDMAGRTVRVPRTIERVFCTNPIGTVDIYALAPELLCGWNFKPAGDSRAYVPKRYLKLPALGVWMGSGSTPNAEEIAKQDPDVLLCFWTADDAGAKMADSIADETGLPVVVVDYDIRHLKKRFAFLGRLLGCKARARELTECCEGLIDRATSVALAVDEAARASVFLAQGKDGLTTDPVGSMHVSDALEMLGVANVADMPGTAGKGMGMPSVNLEQVISWNPTAVLVSEYSMSNAESSDIYAQIKGDAHWQNVAAVAEGRIYRIPAAPFSWFGRPPSSMRALGCLWLASVLYPDAFAAVGIDLEDEARSFYRTFLNCDIDDERLGELLHVN